LNRPLADFDGSLQALRGERILHGSSSFEQDRSEPVRQSPGTLLMMPLRRFAPAAALLLTAIGVVPATAQVVVYRPMVPMFAPAAGPYVANYTPAGNYAAVTAFSPPVMETVAMPVVAAPVMTEMVAPALPVTSFYAPSYAAPTYAAPAPVATTAFYAPAAPAMMAAPVMAAPVTTYYAPTAVAVPLYRRGLFGAYRPVRAAYYPYY
jgi:hypothetical protein